MRGRTRRWASPIACHIVGVSTCATLLLASVWVWLRPHRAVTEVTVDGVVVSLDDAAQLIADADRWRDQFDQSNQRSQEIENRVRSISQWLPDDVPQDEMEGLVTSHAELNQLTLVSIETGDRHVGTRVGVVAANCRLRGSYSGLCRFLHSLSQGPKPVDCSAVTIERIEPTTESDPPNESPCVATVTLRFPFGPPSSLAGRLLSEAMNDAS